MFLEKNENIHDFDHKKRPTKKLVLNFFFKKKKVV
ncbi:Hypothetical Protein SLY_0880 [Strawberry lethal yellows phytoplasma (CPA) str. NZSb11]|uniref:Uncharacterized protein n=1 Tax=Strawberry lethal yellows phytoplasma (CPA) str. NZSb11 TaxID=980422 RepID=R4RQK9_PHYAS|nr:Hypothetical Protein SLY_0880 [Strawberry lethal yellows phytoplasma (CPA) str. NZSb11]